MDKPVTLICLPFAGGNKYSYRDFSTKMPSFIKISVLEYPGRGTRLREPLVQDMGLLVNDLYDQIRANMPEQDYAIYGHSMGGLAAYLLTIKLLENGHKPPMHIFITGTTGPSAVSRIEKKRHLMEKEAFLAEIKELDGMPEEILENEELLHYFEPILRSDFAASENYVHVDRPPLNIPITVITGTGEDMEASDIQLWQKETNFAVDFKRMPGKHFFIFQHTYKIIEIISRKVVNKHQL